MKSLNFIIIKLTLCLSLGIAIAHFTPISLFYSIGSSFGLLIVLGISLYSIKQPFQKHVWFGCIAFITALNFGILTYNVHNQHYFKSHYSHHILNKENPQNLITFRIKEKLKSNNYYSKYIIDVLKINDTKVSGKSLLNVSIDTINPAFKVDDILITSSVFKEISKPLNPNQFDYKAYLEKQYVYQQLFINNTSVLRVESKLHTLFGYAAQLRARVNTQLKHYNFQPNELAIINALLLGQRQDISEEIYNNYINAGAVHILAVSGLHIGIVLLLLNIAFKPIEYFKNGKTFKVILILCLLWGFAIIAGLSPSVTRAVTMFSVIAVAMHLKRPTNIYNTLAISVMCLLLFKPMFLFEVGFQLSYLAVIAIVSIQPLLYKLWKPKFKIMDYLWQIFTVTIAAQFGVVPISLYYFHQFPALFFISNMIIIPFLGVILALGIIVILLSLFNILPVLLVKIYGFIISRMNTIVGWVSKQETFLLKDISISILQVIVFYIVIILCVRLFKNHTFNNLRWSLIAILLLQITFIYTTYTTSTSEFIVFHKNRSTVIGEKLNQNLNLNLNDKHSKILKDKLITNFIVGNGIVSSKVDSLKSIYSIDNKKLLVVDSFGVYNVKSFKPNYVLLSNSPKINLNRLIDSIHPEVIIADGSNFKSYIERWEATCKKQKLPFHNTSEMGAFILK
jgi:competence protein ComEC